MKVVAHFDAGRRGKGESGPCACGAIITSDGVELMRMTHYLGIRTINEGEWEGLLMVLRTIRDAEPFLGAGDELHIYSDSLLVVNQILGIYKARDPRMKAFHAEAMRIAQQIKDRGARVLLTHIPREWNGAADEIVAELLDEKVNKRR